MAHCGKLGSRIAWTASCRPGFGMVIQMEERVATVKKQMLKRTDILFSQPPFEGEQHQAEMETPVLIYL